MQSVVRIKLRIMDGAIDIHTRNFTLNKETSQYYFFEDAEFPDGELSKIKKEDFNKILSANQQDTHRTFFKNAWVSEEGAQKMSEDMLEAAANSFSKVSQIANNNLQKINELKTIL